MKRSIFTCVVFCVCGAALANEPTPAEPKSVLATAPAASTQVTVSTPIGSAQVVVSASADCDNCRREPRRTRTRSVAEACVSDGCQNYSVRTVDDEVTRRRWFGGGLVVRKNSRTIQRPVR